MQIANGAWAGRRCFIIGGGPSAQGFDFSLVRDELTIGINMAFVHNPTINLIYDLRLMRKLTGDPAWQSYAGGKYWLNSEAPNDRGRFPGVIELYESVHKFLRQPVWSGSLADGLFRGNNAGVAALNLADILGANPICLIGYDFKGQGGASANWHNAYPAEWQRQEGIYKEYVECFESIKSILKGKVINLNPDSALTCFPFSTVEVGGTKLAPKVSVVTAKPVRGVIVNGPEGFGDTLYLRAAIRRLAEQWDAVFVRTPWPQLFHDIPKARPARPSGIFYRTQNVNVSRVPPAIWSYPPGGLAELPGIYNVGHFRAGTGILSSLMKQLKVTDPVDFSLTVDPTWEPEWLKDVPRPFGIVHPPSIRREWLNTARNPRPEYVQAVLDTRQDVHWISVGFNVQGHEWFDGPPLRGIARRFDNGELTANQLLAVLAKADLAVSGPCWMLPAAAALRTPLFCIFGGSIPPQFLVEPRMGGTIKTVSPVPFCACLLNEHTCNKTISLGTLMMEWNRFCDSIKERVSA